MAKTAIFTMKLEVELRDEFVTATTNAKKYASEVVRDLMREYIQRQKDEVYYKEYIRKRVATARAMSTDGDLLPDDKLASVYMLKEQELDADEDNDYRAEEDEPVEW